MTCPFYKGVVTVRLGDVYYSEDGITWIEVSKDTSGGFVSEATLAGLGSLTRTTTGLEEYESDKWNNGIDEEMILVDSVGSNPIARFAIRDNAGNNEYFYQEATDADWGGVARFPSSVAVLGDRILYGKDPAFKTSSYYTDLFEPFGFVAGGEVLIADEVEAVSSFRETAVIFGRNTIHRWSDIGDPVNEAALPITTNLGCLAKGSIQELGGDLIFLAPDGLRTLAGTAKIGDLELGSMSAPINSEMPDIVDQLDTLTVTSAVIRKRNNYRLFFHNRDVTDATQFGFGLVLKRTPQGSVWEWNRFTSLPIWSLCSGFDTAGIEMVYHTANINGRPFVYRHNFGIDFDGSRINGSFKIPYIVMGDPEFRKSIHSIRVYSKGEGFAYNYQFKLSYDTDDGNAMSPGTYFTDNTIADSTYGAGQYAAAAYGSGSKETLVFNVEGSGKAFDITFASKGDTPPFTIQGISVSYFANGRY
jgi:hypothetical protein